MNGLLDRLFRMLLIRLLLGLRQIVSRIQTHSSMSKNSAMAYAGTSKVPWEVQGMIWTHALQMEKPIPEHRSSRSKHKQSCSPAVCTKSRPVWFSADISAARSICSSQPGAAKCNGSGTDASIPISDGYGHGSSILYKWSCSPVFRTKSRPIWLFANIYAATSSMHVFTPTKCSQMLWCGDACLYIQ